MDGMTRPDGAGRPPRPSEWIDEACDRFEAAWRAGGRRPRIEDELGAAAEEQRPALLRELLAVELELRRREGERPERREYQSRFPEHAASIAAAFAATPGRVAGDRSGRSGSETDHDLLFGTVALQNSFVGRESLLDAFNAWALDRSRPLGQVLLDRGALTGAQLALLEVLVQEHLKLHGDEPRRSLAALCSVGPAHHNLAKVADPEVQARLAHIEITHARDDPPGVAGDSLPGPPARPFVRFRILRPHARGGLGEVYAAHDEELNREVALKEIQARYAHDPQSRARFLMEAEITGGLEHPGIVPVYGLGHYADGRPFYAMRFIRGDSLQGAILRFHALEGPGRDPGERTLALREILGRFVDVCNAVAYAHSRGVLHRDLKPGNILLGPYGETLVVDWGLAKPIGHPWGPGPIEEGMLRPSSARGSATTQQGTALGTPAYMSPEQAAGRLDELGPASDVYSLGATLYCVLTGRAPADGPDVVALLQRVQTGEFPAPRQVRHEVPKALEAVCLKAMALRPERRYPSPMSLAEDIEHWLADEPVAAYPERLGSRLARWARHHRSWAGAAVVALLVVAVVASVATIAINQARRGEREALGNATKFLAAERAAKAEAQANLGMAETNYALARDAVDRFLTRVGEDQLLNEPYMETLRKDLLDAALVFYQRFVNESRGSRVSQIDLGRAYLNLSKISGSMGSMRDSIAHGEKARSIFAALDAGSPAAVSHRRDLALSHYRLGNLYRDTGAFEQAEAAYKEALMIQEALSAEHPEDAVARDELATSHNGLGNLYVTVGRLAGAEMEYQHAAEIRQELAIKHPEVPAYRRNLAMVRHNQGEFFSKYGPLSKAESHIKQAMEARRKLVVEHPKVAQYRDDLSMSHTNQGAYAMAKGRFKEAEADFRRALEISEKLAAEHPEIVEYRRKQVLLHFNMGYVFQALTRLTEAGAEYRKAVEIGEELATEHPEIVEYRRVLATCLVTLANFHSSEGRHADVEMTTRRALALREEIAAGHPEMAGCRNDVVSALLNLGNFYMKHGRLAEATSSLERAEGIIERLAAEQPRVAEYRHNLAAVHLNLGLISAAAGRLAEARTKEERAKQIFQGLADAYPEITQYRRTLALTCNDLGELEQRLGRLAEAEIVHLQALTLSEKLCAEAPGSLDAAVDLARACGCLGNLERDRDQPRHAYDWYTRALEILQTAQQGGLHSSEAKGILYRVHMQRAEVLTRLGRHVDSVADWERVIELGGARASEPVRLKMAGALARSGDYARALAAIEALANIPVDRRYYEIARIHALVSAADDDSGRNPVEHARRSERLAARAVVWLRQAYIAGMFRDPALVAQLLERNPDLDSLRERTDFHLLMMDVGFPDDPFVRTP